LRKIASPHTEPDKQITILLSTILLQGRVNGHLGVIGTRVFAKIFQNREQDPNRAWIDQIGKQN
jgi:hypothetical protein